MESNLGLHDAVASNDVDLVKQLLIEGADPCAKDEQVCAIAASQSLQRTDGEAAAKHCTSKHVAMCTGADSNTFCEACFAFF